MSDGQDTLWKLAPERRDLLMSDVRAVLAGADADIAARNPVCRASGLCCKFEEYGHRLYVTHAELLYFAQEITQEAVTGHADAKFRDVSLPQFFAGRSVAGCPYQVEGLCTARGARPLGCRIYFCDESARSWQNEVYERHHARLQALHARHDLPYGYVEWRAGLKMMAEHQASLGTMPMAPDKDGKSVGGRT